MIEEMISPSNMPTFYCPYCAEKAEIVLEDREYYVYCDQFNADHSFNAIYEEEAWVDYEMIYYLSSIDYRMPDFSLNIYFPMGKTFIFSRENKIIQRILTTVDVTEWPLYNYPELLKQIKLVVAFS